MEKQYLIYFEVIGRNRNDNRRSGDESFQSRGVGVLEFAYEDELWLSAY